MSTPTGTPPESPARPNHRTRSIASATLIVLACVMSALSVVAVWTRNTLLDTDRYVETVAPLADNPQIQEAVADQITEALVEQVDLDQLVQEALPERAQFLANPVAQAVEQFVHDATLKFVQSDQFQKLWEEANRLAHAQVKKLLTGGGEAVDTENGQVVLKLDNVIDQVKTRLEEAGLDFVDQVDIQGEDIVLFQSDQLQKAQRGVDWLNKLAYALPVITVLLFVAGVFFATNRRAAALRGLLGVVGAMLVLIAAVAVGRQVYLDALPLKVVSRGTAAAAFDSVVRFFARATRIVLFVGLIAALAAWIAGPSRSAVRLREFFHGLLGKATDTVKPGPVVDWTSEYRAGLRVATVATPALVLVFMDAPSLFTMFVLFAVVLLGMAIIEAAHRVHERGVAASPKG